MRHNKRATSLHMLICQLSVLFLIRNLKKRTWHTVYHLMEHNWVLHEVFKECKKICAVPFFSFKSILFLLRHWSQTQFLEGHSSAQFRSNPNQTHLIQLISVFRITRNFQTGVSWSWLELNSAELWPSRNWVWDQCPKESEEKYVRQSQCLN